MPVAPFTHIRCDTDTADICWRQVRVFIFGLSTVVFTYTYRPVDQVDVRVFVCWLSVALYTDKQR